VRARIQVENRLDVFVWRLDVADTSQFNGRVSDTVLTVEECSPRAGLWELSERVTSTFTGRWPLSTDWMSISSKSTGESMSGTQSVPSFRKDSRPQRRMRVLAVPEDPPVLASATYRIRYFEPLLQDCWLAKVYR
jgi:hypothetical protein